MARQGSPVSRVWILAFFVMGVVIGLLLLVLEQGFPHSWVAAERPVASARGEVQHVPAERPAPVPTTRGKAVPIQEPANIEPARIEALRCDHEAAQRVWDKALSLASISEQGGVIQLAMTREWEFYSPGHRRSFVETFSEAVRCLQGHYRELLFRYHGDAVAHVTDKGAVKMN